MTIVGEDCTDIMLDEVHKQNISQNTHPVVHTSDNAPSLSIILISSAAFKTFS